MKKNKLLQEFKADIPVQFFKEYSLSDGNSEMIIAVQDSNLVKKNLTCNDVIINAICFLVGCLDIDDPYSSEKASISIIDRVGGFLRSNYFVHESDDMNILLVKEFIEYFIETDKHKIKEFSNLLDRQVDFED